MPEEVADVVLRTCEKVVQAEHLVPFLKKTVAQMRSQKSRAAGH
jgi:hypothetical protein